MGCCINTIIIIIMRYKIIYFLRFNCRMQKQDHVEYKQLENRKFLEKILEHNNIPSSDKINNLGLYLKTGSLSHILFCNEAYSLIKNIPGVIMEFGVWFGQNQIIFENLRAIHEPFNKLRKVLGFDTFTGYPETSKSVHDNKAVEKGYIDTDIYDLKENYCDFLKDVIHFHESNNVLGHKHINDIIKGNIEDTLPIYLEKHNSTVVALIYLDLALYSSTKFVLESILPYLVKGSVIIFDEFNHPDIVGDTLAFRDIFIKNNINYEIKLSTYMREKTFLIIM